MAFGIYNLFEAFLLIVNAVAVLHEQRFLDKSECRDVFAIRQIVDALPATGFH